MAIQTVRFLLTHMPKSQLFILYTHNTYAQGYEVSSNVSSQIAQTSMSDFNTIKLNNKVTCPSHVEP